jgi:peptidoglycan/LPS O-acetylase OafA/YrhL
MSARRINIHSSIRQIQSTPRSPVRLAELDALRGIAAISVVFSHFRLLWLGESTNSLSARASQIIYYLMSPFCAGPEAVILFFILSGFVLSIPAIESHPQPYWVFVVRRIFRIYGPYFVAISFAILAAIFFHGHVSRSEWLNRSWSTAVDWHLVAQHLAFLGEYNTFQFDDPIWSLIYEMRISLFFPILCALVLRLKPEQMLLTAVSVSALTLAVMNHGSFRIHFNPYLLTMHYAGLFIVGIYLARERKRLSAIYSQLSWRIQYALMTLAVGLYIYGREFQLRIASKCPDYDPTFLSDWTTTIGAAVLIVISLNSILVRRILLWAPIQCLGKISYSVYLLHFVIMLLLVHLFYGRLSLPLIFVFCLLFSLGASWMFYRLVELPFISLGRRLTSNV